MARYSWLFMVLFLSLSLGCAVKHEPRWAGNSTIPEQIRPQRPKSVTPGSLWTNRGKSMFKDNKAQMVGDIVTVAIYEQASASKEANTATGRSSEISAGIPNFFGLEGSGPVLKNPLDPSKLVQGEFNNDFSGQGSTSRKANLSATIAAQVVEVLPNDNLRIFGRKRVQVNNEEQFIGLSGVIRPQDISAQNMVNSKYIVNAEITYTGRGPLSDKQRPGWLMRLLDTIWPF